MSDYKRVDGGGPPQVIPYYEERAKENLVNLITNSGLGLWSGAVSFEPAKNPVINGSFQSVVGWATTNCTASSSSGGAVMNCLTLTRTGGTVQEVTQVVPVNIGTRYHLHAFVKSGTSGDEAFALKLVVPGSGVVKATYTGVSTSTWLWHSINDVWVADVPYITVVLQKSTATAGTMLFDEVTLEEVGAELIVNGTMALDSNWSNLGNPSLNERSTTQVHSGTYSRKWANNTPAGSDGIKSDAFTSVTGKCYRVSAWVYPEYTSVRLAIYKGSDGTPLWSVPFSGLTTGAWNRLTYTYQETAGGTKAAVGIYNGNGGDAQICYVDDVQCFEISSNLVGFGGYDQNYGWTPINGTTATIAGGSVGNCLELTRTGGTTQQVYNTTDAVVVVGKVYKASVLIKSGTSGNEAVKLSVQDSGGAILGETTGTTGTSWNQQLTVTVEAVSTGMKILLTKNTATAGTMLFDQMTLVEVYPSTIAANSLTADGWEKEYSLFTAKDTSVTLPNSCCSIRMQKSVDGNEGLYWPKGIYTGVGWRTQFANKTVTFGAWVKTNKANNVKLCISDGSNIAESTYHTGSGNWERLTVTKVFPAAPTQARFMVFNAADTGDVAWMTQPIAVFGTYLPPYAPIPNEIILCDVAITGALLNAYTPSSGTVYTGAEFSGKLPRNTRAVLASLRGQNSSAGTLASLGDASGSYKLNVYFTTANQSIDLQGWVKCNSAGNLYLNVSPNTSAVTLKAIGVQL